MATQSTYKHSKVFAALKDTKETIAHNLTSAQYLFVLDELLDKACFPLLDNSSLFDTALSRMIGWQEKNFRRKVSFGSRVEVPRLILNFLLVKDTESRRKNFKAIGLDRGLRIKLLMTFHTNAEEYMRACDYDLRDPETHQLSLSYCNHIKHSFEAAHRSRDSLFRHLKESQFWLLKATSFKQCIIEKYLRLSLSVAQRDYVGYFQHEANLDDMIQWYVLAASRAIDKCDATQGTLTSHVQNWFLTARNRVADERQLDKSNIQVELLDFDSDSMRSSTTQMHLSTEDNIVNVESSRALSYLARVADPLGAARLLMGIEEQLTEQELDNLKAISC